MEGSLKIVQVCGGRANRLAGLTNGRGEMDFRRRPSGGVCKPPYAAMTETAFVVNDKEKRGL